jgi:hypothetical protein
MGYLDYLKEFSTIIAAIIAGFSSMIIEFIRSNRNEKKKSNYTPFIWLADGTKYTIPLKKKSKLNFNMTAIFVVLGGLFGFIGASIVVTDAGELPISDVYTPVITSTQESLMTPSSGLTPTLLPIPTPISFGDAFLEINFTRRGEGDCNDYDSDRLGYYEEQYYIHPDTNGYIAICHDGKNRIPPGALQVVAHPESSSSFFGYGLLFGWKGGGISTTDACFMGIRKSGERTEAVFVDWVENNYKATTQVLDDLVLDNQPHTLRIVLQSNNMAQGYLDGKFFAEHQFIQCSKGPIGMVAWGDGQQKTFFDDLKLFDMP